MSANTTPTPPDAVALLGVLSDTEMGRRFGVSSAVARGWRTRAGIPIAALALPPPADARAFLGRMTDKAAGEHFGVSCGTTYRWRRELGIPPSDPRGARHVHRGVPPSRREVLDTARTLIDNARPTRGGMFVPLSDYVALHRLLYPLDGLDSRPPIG